MFSAHGTDEEVVEDTFAEDEERRRQLRVSMLEGLRVGGEEGEYYEGKNEDEGKIESESESVESAKATEDENAKAASAVPPSAAAVLFSPRRKQSFRNTFGFIAPGDIPTGDDDDDEVGPPAPAQLRVSKDVPPAASVNADAARAARPAADTALVMDPLGSPETKAASPASPVTQRASPTSPLRSQPAPPPRTIRPAPGSPSPLARSAQAQPAGAAAAALGSSSETTPTASASPQIPRTMPPASPTRPIPGAGQPLTNSGSSTLRQVTPPVGSPGARGPPPATPFRSPAGRGVGGPPPQLPPELPLPPAGESDSSSTSILAPALPVLSPLPASGGPGVPAGRGFARPPPPNGVGRPSGTSTMRTGATPPVPQRSPNLPAHATIRSPPPVAPRAGSNPSGSPASSSPGSTSPIPTILSPRLGSAGSASTAPQREVDEFVETISKKGSISVHCSIEKREKYVVGTEVAIKVRIINDSDKIIRHVSAALAKSSEKAKEKRRDSNKSVAKFDGTEEMISFTSNKFPLEKGLFDGIFNYKIPPCKEGSYSAFNVDLVVELAFKKSAIYAFLPIKL